MDFWNYKKVCEQASYIKYLEEKLADAERANEGFAEANQNLQQQLYAVSVELGKYKSLEAMMGANMKKMKKGGNKKVDKDKIGFIN